MKTVKIQNEIRRMSDSDADQLVSHGRAVYISKSEWKASEAVNESIKASKPKKVNEKKQKKLSKLKGQQRK